MAEEGAAQSDAGGGDAGGAKGGGGKPTPFIILAIFNMVFVLGVGAMLYMGKQKEAAEPGIDDVVKGEHETHKKELEGDENFIGKVIPLETFIINLAGSRGRKVLKINMELEIEGEKLEEEIDKRKAQIRDIIIILLSSKTYEEIVTREGKDYLRNEIRDTVNAFLTQGQINKVFFTELIYN